MGGVSAAVSKTAAAPIERIKLLIQNQVRTVMRMFFLFVPMLPKQTDGTNVKRPGALDSYLDAVSSLPLAAYAMILFDPLDLTRTISLI